MANRLNVPRTGQDVTIALVEHDPARTVALELEPATFDFGNADGHTTGSGSRVVSEKVQRRRHAQ